MQAHLFVVLLLGFLIGAGGCSAGRTSGTLPPHARYGAGLDQGPAWLPPYTEAQLALLDEGADTPVQVPVRRVFPDLTRFGYGSNRKLDQPFDTVLFTKLFARVVTQSPHFYVITEAPPDVHNAIAQYGPPGAAEPDAWEIVRRSEDGAGELLKAPVTAEAKADFDRGKAALESDKAAALEAFRDAVEKSPKVPAFWMAIAEAHAASGDDVKAEDAYQGALVIDPTIATAHTALAEIYEKRGQLSKARREVAEALAYHPGSKRALAVAETIARGGVETGRVRPYRVFLDVTGSGAVRVAAPGGVPGQMYGSCRAVLRYEPTVRAKLFDQSERTPYFLSAVEEVICLEAAIGAYLFERRSDTEAKPDPNAEQLLELAQSEGLLGYAMFEILGQHRPERARMAPESVHRAIVEYVEHHVLGEGRPLPEGVYQATR